jgi:hypothetical protein
MVQGLAVASTFDAYPSLIWNGIIGQNKEVWDVTLKIEVSPQLNESPRTAGFEFLLGEQAQRH